MSYNIGPKIGIDGEAEFRRQIRDINSEYKTLEAETRALTASFRANGDEQGELIAISSQCAKQIDKQKEKISLLGDAVDKASAKYGENSVEATRLRGALFDTQATVSKLQGEMQNADRKLESFEGGLDDLGDAANEAGDDVLEFSDVLGANLAANLSTNLLEKAVDVVADFAKGSLDAAADVKAAGSQFEQTFGDMESEATSVLHGISEETNIASTRIQGDFTRIFAFMKTNGADSAAALSMSERAIKAAADSAAYYDRTVEEATETLQSFLKGNYANDAALGISATETTRNAKANELFAKSFKDLSEAQKVETLLAMVEAGNQASGAMGQAARESEEWTNVLGEAGEAVRMLQAQVGKPAIKLAIPVVKEFTDVLKELTKETDLQKLTGEMDAFNASVDSAGSRYEETAAGIEANAFAAEKYLSYLEQLEAEGLQTAAAQKTYANVVAELNELMPGYNFTLDKQTGLLEQNKAAIRGSVEAMKEQALFAAKQERVTSILQAQGKAALALEDAERALSDAKSEGAALEAERASVGNELLAVNTELTEIEKELASSYGASASGALDLQQRQKELQEESIRLSGEYAKLDGELDKNTQSQDELNQAITAGKEAVSQYDSELAAVTETESQLSTENAALEASIMQVQQEVDALNQAYMDAKAEARDSIDRQIGLFDELSMESDISAQKIIDNWVAQQEAFTKYEDNLKTATELGLDETLVKQLSDGSEESMLILDALVNSTELSVDEINEQFRRTSESKDSLAETLGGLQTEFEDEMGELEKKAENSGMAIVDGLVVGVESRKPSFGSAMSTLGNHGLGKFNEYMQIHSPSRKMEKSGGYTVAGVVNEVRNKTREFEDAMSDLALRGYDAFRGQKMNLEAYVPGGQLAIQDNSAPGRVSHEYQFGGINIYQQPGEDADDLAERIMDSIQAKIESKEAAVC